MPHSTTMKKLRRQFTAERKFVAAFARPFKKPTYSPPGNVADPCRRKSVHPPPPPPPPTPCSMSSPSATARGAAERKVVALFARHFKKSAPPSPATVVDAGRRKRIQPPPPPPPCSTSRGAAPAEPCKALRCGTTVLVRTRVGRLPITGQWLVMWLSAVVISAAEDEHVDVVYNGKFPPEAPFSTVAVSYDNIKLPPPPHASSGATTPMADMQQPEMSTSTQAKRPTVAWKSLPSLLR